MRVALLAILAVAIAAPAFAMTADVSPTHGVPHPERGTFPIVHSWGIPDDAYCVGIGFDATYVWVSAGDQAGFGCRFHIFDELGNVIDVRPQGAGASGWGHRDMTTYAECADAFTMLGSYSMQINGFFFDSSHQGFFQGAINPNRALAAHAEGSATRVWTGGFGEYVWTAEWNRTWGATVSWSQLTGATVSGTYGLAFDFSTGPEQGRLWMTTADYTGSLFLYDLAGNVIGSYTFLPEYDIQGGCTMGQTQTFGCVLMVLHQSSPDQVAYYDVNGTCPVQEMSWGSIKAMFN